MKRFLLCLPLLLTMGFADDEASVQIRIIEAMKPPKFEIDRMGDPAYREAHNTEAMQFQSDRNSRISDLYKRFPKNPQVRKLMIDRWLSLARTGQRKLLLDETAPMLKDTSDPGERLDLMYVRAEAQIWPPANFDTAMAAADEFVKAAPNDERGAELLFYLASGETDRDRQLRLFRRAAAAPYSDTSYGKLAKGCATQVAGIGKPFELSFSDVTSGKAIDLANDFKGKIVVIDFWATWCGPCLASMPENNSLAAAYKKHGVEFVGVSMDYPEQTGGLTALKKCIQESKIDWPQYYQGNGPESAFSSKWAVLIAPTIFIIGRDGKLFSTTASGKLKSVLDEMLRKETNEKVRSPGE